MAPGPAHLTATVHQDVLVLTITEEQVQGDELADALRQEMLDAVATAGVMKVAFDFRDVRYLGSAGFRPLLSVYRKLQGQGGRMVFCNLAPEVAEVFLITRLATTSRSTVAPFEIAPDLPAALARLSS
jgi:anti-anti-sigma factor